MKIAAVTCTGKRPQMFQLCVRWIMQQTRPPDLWVISLGKGESLGISEILLPTFAVVHRWDETIGSQLHGQIDSNTKYQVEAISQVPIGYAAAYFDDDDWYGSDYLETVEQSLTTNDITGNGLERRYSLKLNRWMEISKSGCNAGAVAMQHHAIADWIEWLQDPKTKWGWLTARHRVDLRNEAPRVSIKHGPGLGHLFPPAEHKWKSEDYRWSMLHRWIGPDVRHYEELMATCEQ